ncbi:Glyoxalase-like domain protein [compost metagenome]
MMTKDIWINLPVKDLDKSKEFFTTLGFPLHPQHIDNDEMAGLVIGDKSVMVMFFPETTFETFTSTKIADTQQGTEVLLSIGAESREEVDELMNRVVKAGGTIYSKPQDQGWMYGAGFADLDGHRWNVLYMDMDRDTDHK